MAELTTIDFHVTSECSQECPYCWGPQDVDAVDTATAEAIIARIAAVGARRIVFTGGDPMKRSDIGRLVGYARERGLEVALSTTGDELTEAFLAAHAGDLDLVSLPLDGSTEDISIRTKKPGHFGAVMAALGLLSHHPTIDVKVATPVTRHNLTDVPNIVHLLDNVAGRIPNRMFYNVFQAFPRSMSDDVAWDELVVTDDEFSALRTLVESEPHDFRINWLSHETLDRLYLMVFPDGSLTIPAGSAFRFYGRFLDIDDLDAVIAHSEFDLAKHQHHARGWTKGEAGPD